MKAYPQGHYMSNGQDRAPDHEAACRGTVPWSLEGVMDVLEWADKLAQTPKDDWDLGRRSVTIRDARDSEPTEMCIDMANPMNQLMMYLKEKWPQQFPYHGLRFMRLMEFLHEHDALLIAEGLVREDDKREVSRPLLQALAELPFTKPSMEDGREEPSWKYDYALVTARAKEIRMHSAGKQAEPEG